MFGKEERGGEGESIEESGGSVFYDFCSLVEGGGLGELGPPKLFDSIVNV